ncbi:MAG TPA: NnrS family protein [Casimicrobiaceae bacterium]|nr:NnrS family protein [Casimicrobiaceae bacterium]
MQKPIPLQRPTSNVQPGLAEFALWRLGFRPFYLMAGIFAALSVPLWVCQYAGYLPAAYLRGMVWHGHEMLFGYALAVITGFLFTAVRNWTGRPTPTGAALAGIAALWIAGRILVLTPYDVAAAVVNGAFPVAVAIGIGVPLVRSGNKRNYFFVVLLLMFGALALALHLSYLRMMNWPELVSLQVGLDLVLLIIAAIGGRVIPMFTNNGVPGAGAASKLYVEKLALASIAVLGAADLLQAPGPVIAGVALVAAAVHGTRLYLWRFWRTLRTPLVWVLHGAYAWIVLHLVLRAMAASGLIGEPLAVHALTIGGIGGMTMGMMTRTSRGHTGRLLQAGWPEATCFALVFCSALVRVVGGILLPGIYMATVIVSGALWSAAFALFAITYWPILTRARLDGKPG